VAAKARAKPASEALTLGDKTQTKAVTPITAEDKRLNRTESQRLTARGSINRCTMIQTQKLTYLPTSSSMDLCSKYHHHAIREGTSEQSTASDTYDIDTTKHISQELGGCSECTNNCNARNCFAIDGIKRRASDRICNNKRDR
jgi:hypothetical protein